MELFSSESSTGSNKRKFLRLPRPYRVQARELVFPIAKDPLFNSNCSDISKGGLCVESSSPLPVGTRLHVNVHIPLLNKFSSGFLKVYENEQEQYFQAIAEVSWVDTRSGIAIMGLKFINADEELCNSLEKLVEDAFSNLEQ